MADEARIDDLIKQLPFTYSILENVKAKFGFGIKDTGVQVELGRADNESTIRKIRKLEKFLTRADAINTRRPARTLEAMRNGEHFWWVKESFKARKIILPTPVLLEKFGIVALTIWISDPKRISKPKKDYDWVGSFLYLPTIHFDTGKTTTTISGCSALQFLANVSENRNLFSRDPKEPLGRGSRKHPIEKLEQLGAFVSDERQLESLYFVRYITDEQVYSPHGQPIRVNDVVGYPIYISAYPPTKLSSVATFKPPNIAMASEDGWFFGGPSD